MNRMTSPILSGSWMMLWYAKVEMKPPSHLPVVSGPNDSATSTVYQPQHRQKKPVRMYANHTMPCGQSPS